MGKKLNKISKLSILLFSLRVVSLSLLGEAATAGVLQEFLFLKILQNLQGKTCARVSFLIKF